MKQGWIETGLGEICEVLDTKRKPITKRNRTEGDIPYYGATGIVDWVKDYIFDEPLILLGEDGAKWDSGENSAFKIEGKTWVNNHAHVLRPIREKVMDNWLIYNLNYQNLLSFVTGLTVPKLNQGNMRTIPIPIPPLEEQKRIVTKLDECFEAIDKARVNVEKNLNNAKELFQSQLNQIFSQKGDGWVEKKLGEVCIVERGSSPRPIKDYLTESEDGVNWIKIGDTKNVEKYIYATKQKITKEGANRSRFVDVGDFILTNSMTYGKPYIMKTKGYIHDGWFVLRLPDEINSEFFWYLLASPYTMEQFEYLAAGAIVKNISGDLVKKAILPIPPIGEQATIVEKMDTLSSQTQFLESNFQQELDALDELKKSILQKAFNGEL